MPSRGTRLERNAVLNLKFVLFCFVNSSAPTKPRISQESQLAIGYWIPNPAALQPLP